MFTGIIEDIGRMSRVRRRAEGLRLEIATRLPAESLPLGCSVAVNGVCLTVCAHEKGAFAADVGHETARVTTLGRARTGQRVHLERALAFGGRLDGHLVTGHVDGVGEVLERAERGSGIDLLLRAPEAVRPFLIEKGSVALDGVSLTVNAPTADAFAVALVPHTLEKTCLGELRPGGAVNLEADIIGKYIRHFVAPAGRGVDESFLAEHGFLKPGGRFC